jgi:hypothetical protein
MGATRLKAVFVLFMQTIISGDGESSIFLSGLPGLGISLPITKIVVMPAICHIFKKNERRDSINI